jgi:glucosyl-3-phosphoglycerate phosphatase
MDVYFVRHGQTDGNLAKRHQHPNIALNETGKAQAAAVTAVIKSLAPTHLITSTNRRAVETATAIGSACDLIPQTDASFEELHRPQYLIGQRFGTVTTLSYVWRWFFGIPTAAMHDGESYAAFLDRLTAARQLLTALPGDSRVVVVSHAVFIHFFIEHMNRPYRMNLLRAAVRFFKILRLENTAIIHIRYQNGAWRILS